MTRMIGGETIIILRGLLSRIGRRKGMKDRRRA